MGIDRGPELEISAWWARVLGWRRESGFVGCGLESWAPEFAVLGGTWSVRAWGVRLTGARGEEKL